jgi:3-isopropylmalate dehydrogenase
MAEVSRALDHVARMHGFRLEDEHLPFGGEAVSRYGHPLPLPSRSALLESDAVLVAVGGEPALDGIEAELDLRAAVTHVRLGDGHVVYVLSPQADDVADWTVHRAFGLARATRGRLTSLDSDGGWAEMVDRLAEHHEGVAVEHLSAAMGLPALAFEPERFDVVVTSPSFAETAGQIVASVEREPRIVAYGRLAGNGPGVFAPAHGSQADIAGQGVANPSSLLLAAALMLGEGLGQRAAAEALGGAVEGACRTRLRTLDRLLSGIAATTREFTDVVLRELPVTTPNVEFRGVRG